jgi:hypothetical protein
MRAQFIRGQDPKDAMKIGNLYSRIDNQIVQTIKLLIKEYNLDPDSILTPNNLDNIITADEMTWGVAGIKHTYYISYWFLMEEFLAGCIENQYQTSEQIETKDIKEVINFLRKKLEENEK